MSANGKRKPSFLSQDEEEEEDTGGGGGGEGDHAGLSLDSLGKDLVDDDDFPIDLKVSGEVRVRTPTFKSIQGGSSGHGPRLG